MGNNIFLLVDEAAGQFVVVDPSLESAPVLQRARQLCADGLTPTAIWNTHGHFDHIYDNALWKSAFDVPLLMHEADLFFVERLREQALWFGMEAPEQVPPDEFLADGQILQVGSHQAQVIHTPGHSPGSVSFYFRESNACISGDVIFPGGAGRVDLPGANAPHLMKSLETLLALPEATRLLPGHYHETTVGRERLSNPAWREGIAFLQGN